VLSLLFPLMPPFESGVPVSLIFLPTYFVRSMSLRATSVHEVAGIAGAPTEGSRSAEGEAGVADSVKVNVRPSAAAATQPVAVFWSDGLAATAEAAAAVARRVEAGCGV